MRRTEALQGVRMTVFLNVLNRWESAELNQEEAAALLGVSERTFRHWTRRYEEDGEAGLLDGRLGKSARLDGRKRGNDRAREDQRISPTYLAKPGRRTRSALLLSRFRPTSPDFSNGRGHGANRAFPPADSRGLLELRREVGAGPGSPPSISRLSAPLRQSRHSPISSCRRGSRKLPLRAASWKLASIGRSRSSEWPTIHQTSAPLRTRVENRPFLEVR